MRHDSYDVDEYISPQEMDATKHLANGILNYLNRALRADMEIMEEDDPQMGWRKQREMLDVVGREHIRFFNSAIARLSDEVEIKFGLITRYRRRDLRRVPQRNGSNAEFFASMGPKKKTYPAEAFNGGRKK